MTPSPSSYALAKRQVVTRPIRIRPTSWFKESRGQDFWRWLDFCWLIVLNRGYQQNCVHRGVNWNKCEWFAPIRRCASRVCLLNLEAKHDVEGERYDGDLFRFSRLISSLLLLSHTIDYNFVIPTTYDFTELFDPRWSDNNLKNSRGNYSSSNKLLCKNNSNSISSNGRKDKSRNDNRSPASREVSCDEIWIIKESYSWAIAHRIWRIQARWIIRKIYLDELKIYCTLINLFCNVTSRYCDCLWKIINDAYFHDIYFF